MFTCPQSVLVVIDIQGKLAETVYQSETLIDHTRRLVQAAQILDIPIIITEQKPEKIGFTVDAIQSVLPDKIPIRKASFSCCGEERFTKALHDTKRHQVIVCGIEAHVCVYQTVVHLLEQSLQVQIVADAISSRTVENKNIACQRMVQLGAGLTSTEMILTELLQTSDHPHFKEILNFIR